MKNVLITGGTGMIGKELCKQLIKKGYSVTILSRKKVQDKNGIRYSEWDIEKQEIDKDLFAETDYIFHLAGAGIADKRWTAKRKKEILSSRTRSSALLVNALTTIPNKVKLVVSSAATGWYGPDDPNHKKVFTEYDPPYNDFLAQTCRAWEESIEGVVSKDRRLVIFRTGPVLSNEGGMLAEFKKAVKFGIASILGNGSQVISWIHINDLCRMYIKAIEDESLRGIYNAVAPSPVTNRELITELAKKIKGKFFLPVYVPAFALKIILGELSVEVLKSATVSSKKIQSTGFQFVFPDITSALNNLVTGQK